MLKKKTLIYEYLAVNKMTQSKRDYYNSLLSDDEKKYVDQLRLENRELLQNHPFNKIKPVLMVWTSAQHSLRSDSNVKKVSPQHSLRSDSNARKVSDREKEHKKKFSFVKLISIPAVACLCFILITLVIGNLKNDPYQSKGNNISTLFIYELAADDEIKLLRDLSFVKNGALIQLGYKVAEKKYGLIISVDSNRLITYHLKSGTKNPVLLREMNEVAYLPYSYRLDNTPGFELFLFITSDEPFSGDKIIEYILTSKDIENIDFTSLKTITVKKILLHKEKETVDNEES